MVDNDFLQRREEDQRYVEITRGFGGMFHVKNIRNIHNQASMKQFWSVPRSTESAPGGKDPTTIFSKYFLPTSSKRRPKLWRKIPLSTKKVVLPF